MADELKQDLEKILRQHQVENLVKDYSNGSPKEGDVLDYIRNLGGAVAYDENFFLNATPQAIQNETKSYIKFHEKDVKEAIGRSKGTLTDNYKGIVDDGLAGVSEDVKKSIKDLEKLTKEQQAEVIAPHVYGALAKTIVEDTGLELNPEYKDNKELVSAYLAYKSLEKADEGDKKQIIAGALRGSIPWLTDNIINFAPLDPNRARSIIGRKLGKQLVKESNGKYELDKYKFEAAFGTDSNYKKITPIVYDELYGKKYFFPFLTF